MKKKSLILFIIPIFFVVLLLIVQAFCDLELPTYTSSIINDGIASKGIDSNLPEVMTEDVFDAILRITEESPGMLTGYSYIIKDNLNKVDYDNYRKEYPILEKENIYVLKDLNKDDRKIVENIVEKPLILAWMFKSNNESIVNSLGLVNLKEGETALDWLMSLDDESFKTTVESFLKTIDNFDDTMLDEFGALCISEMYQDVGIDMDNYQINFIIYRF